MVFGDGITIRKSRGKKSFKINWTSFFLTDDAKLNLHQDCLLLVPSTQIQMEEIQQQSASGETTVALSHKILKLNCFLYAIHLEFCIHIYCFGLHHSLFPSFAESVGVKTLMQDPDHWGSASQYWPRRSEEVLSNIWSNFTPNQKNSLNVKYNKRKTSRTGSDPTSRPRPVWRTGLDLFLVWFSPVKVRI